MRLENGNSLIINRDSDHGPYVEQLLCDGMPYAHNYIQHPDLLKGMTLDFKMSAQPNLLRGTSPEDAPYSFTEELKARR